jgi:excisionase family DNA binding protein
MSEAAFFTIAGLAEYVGVSTDTVQRALARGELTSYRIGHLRRILKSDAEAWLAARREPAHTTNVVPFKPSKRRRAS